MADAVEIDGIYYNLITKGKVAEVTNNPNNYSGNLIIPEKIIFEGIEYQVTNIGNAAFLWSSELTSITIPNSVTSIGKEAFYGCESLSNINIPNSVISIGEYAFNDCVRLVSIDLPSSITSVPEGAFQNCAGLTSIIIPSSVTSIGYKSFAGCGRLVSITIPNSVISIGEYAFLSCTGLTSITFPTSLKTIAAWAFWNCTGLTSVKFPDSVTTISKYAFYCCTGLTYITFGGGVISIGLNAFASCPELKDVYCYSEMVSVISIDAFKDSYIEYTTLHVPNVSINYFTQVEPWKNFKEIVALEETTSKVPKCAIPIIIYKNGKLSFECETEGVEYITEIADEDVGKFYDSSISLTATYNISVFATKNGYDNSDVSTATLCWIDQQPMTEGISNGVTNVSARAVLIQTQNGNINFQGGEEGSNVTVYDISGAKLASGILRHGEANISTNLQSGSVALVKVGDKAVKVVMK